MKKLIVALLSVLMLMSISGCSKKKEENIGIPNPVSEVATLDELIKAIDMAIYNYEGDDVSDETFKLIDGEYKIAEYDFKVGGRNVDVRASKAPVSADISGVYFNEQTLYAEYLESETSCYIENDDYHSHRWFTLDGQYVITVNVNDFDSQEFETLAKSFETIKPLSWSSDVDYEDYLALCSYYMNDEGDIAAVIMDKDHVRVIVSIGDTDGNVTYEMPAILKDNELVFEGGTATFSSYNFETGEMKEEDRPAFGAGRITVNEGQISFENSGISDIADIVMNKTEF